MGSIMRMILGLMEDVMPWILALASATVLIWALIWAMGLQT